MAVPYAFRKRHEERNHHRPRQIRVISRPSAEQNPDGKDDRHKQNPTVNGKIKHTLQLHSKSLLSETRPLIGMASVDKRRPPKRRALRHAGRRSLPFGHSPERLILPKNRQTNNSRHKAHRPCAPPLRGFPYGASPRERCRRRRGVPSDESFRLRRNSTPARVPPRRRCPRRTFRHGGPDAGSGPTGIPPRRGCRPAPARVPAQ